MLIKISPENVLVLIIVFYAVAAIMCVAVVGTIATLLGGG